MKRIAKIAYALLSINMVIGVINIWRYEPYLASELRTWSATMAALFILAWMAVTAYLLIKEAHKIAKKEFEDYIDKIIDEKIKERKLDEASIATRLQQAGGNTQ